jgi:hypothetical protein
MTIEHEHILGDYFSFVGDEDCVALETRDRRYIPGYRTWRFGKVQDGCLYFTIGATEQGRNANLNAAFEQIIASHGLQLKWIPASHSPPREFVGFDLGCAEETLRSILNEALGEVRIASWEGWYSESRWLNDTDPQDMLEALEGMASARKWRLLLCACCRHIWHRLTDERSRAAVELAERFADGQVGHEELQDARARRPELGREGVVWWTLADASDIVRLDSLDLALSQIAEADKAEYAAQCDLVREVFGRRPLQAVTVSPAVLAYHGGAAHRLAEAIYEGRRFEDLPMLADLLEAAGLTDADLLGHLRGPGPHVLGCWALDAVRGKS